MSPSRSGSFRLGGILPPHLRVFPSSFAASIHFLILPIVFSSLLGIRQETEYFSSPPLTALGSWIFAKEMRQGITIFVALKFFWLICLYLQKHCAMEQISHVLPMGWFMVLSDASLCAFIRHCVFPYT